MHYVSLVIWIIILLGLIAWGQTFRHKQYDIMGKSKYFFAISGLVVLTAVVSLSTRGLNWGLDFTGGTVIEAGASTMVTTTQIRNALGTCPVDLGSYHVQTGADMVTDPTNGSRYQKVVIRLTLRGGKQLPTPKANAVLSYLSSKVAKMQELRISSIGPTISSELAWHAGEALLLALVLQLLYIFLRFGNQLRYGLAVDVALIHDVVIMIGLYSLAGRQVDSPFVAAVLTVVGYSVMDSVVIFDRIRETVTLRRNVPFPKLVNESVNQTMTRSINTTMTVIVTLLAIFFFGGSTLQNFAFALLVGITSGAYSSIGVASPVLMAIAKQVDSKHAEARARAVGSRNGATATSTGDEEGESEDDEATTGGDRSSSSGRKRRRGKRKKS